MKCMDILQTFPRPVTLFVFFEHGCGIPVKRNKKKKNKNKKTPMASTEHNKVSRLNNLHWKDLQQTNKYTDKQTRKQRNKQTNKQAKNSMEGR